MLNKKKEELNKISGNRDELSLKNKSLIQIFTCLLSLFTIFSHKEYLAKSTYSLIRASLVAQTVKNLPAIQETWVQSLGWKDPMEKGMATHFSILVWRIPWTEEPGRIQSTVLQRA